MAKKNSNRKQGKSQQLIDNFIQMSLRNGHLGDAVELIIILLFYVIIFGIVPIRSIVYLIMDI